MTDSDDPFAPLLQGDFPDTLDKVHNSTTLLGISTTSFAKAISRAFSECDERR
jgi:hypothetical protein